MHVGVGLWAMRSTAYDTSSWPSLYRELREDAQLAEALGFDSLWLAEHHLWYDGWCPQPLVAAASVLGCTERLRVGTGMYLLPQHDIDQTSRDVGTLLHTFGDRLDLGVSLGYRNEEFDLVAVPRSHRGRLMDSYLDRLVDEHGSSWVGAPPIWVGGVAEPAIRRAGRLGLSLLLPNTVRADQIARSTNILGEAATQAGLAPGQVGMLIDVWLTDGDEQRGMAALDRIVRHHREYTGAWFGLEGRNGFERPDLMDKQSARTRSVALVGSAESILMGLQRLRHEGVETFVLNVRLDFPRQAHREVMAELAASVVPALRAGAKVPA